MAHQPNIELDAEDLPRAVPLPAPPRRWDPKAKPGVIMAPAQMPWGGVFGTPGPDTGYALRLIEQVEIPERSDELEAVLVALMSARASVFGRAPILQDLEVALALCGLWDGAPEWVAERRRRWLASVAHERGKGRRAVAEVDTDLLRETPERVRWALTRERRAEGDPE